MGLDRLSENIVIAYDRDRITQGGVPLTHYMRDLVRELQNHIYRTNYHVNRLPYPMAWSGGASLDATHPFILDFKIPSEMTTVVSVRLSMKIRPFRAHSTAAASGGGATSSAGGGAVISSAAGGGQTTSSGGGAIISSAAGGGQTTSSGGGAIISSAAGGGQTTSSGGGQTSSVSGAFAGDTTSAQALWDGNTSTEDGSVGNHAHTVQEYSVSGHYHSVSISDHSHTVEAHTHTVSDHTHSVTIANHTHTVSDHTHSVTIANHTHTVSDHAHSVTIANHTHTVPDHVHGLTFGIYEQAASATIYFQVDNGSGYGAVSANYLTDQEDLDITAQITTVGWKSVRFTADSLCYITALLEVKLNITTA